MIYLYALFGILFVALMEVAAENHKWVQVAIFTCSCIYCVIRTARITQTHRVRWMARPKAGTFDEPYSTMAEATRPYDPTVPEETTLRLIREGKIICMKSPPWTCFKCKQKTVDQFKVIKHPTGVTFEATCSNCKEVVYS